MSVAEYCCAFPYNGCSWESWNSLDKWPTRDTSLQSKTLELVYNILSTQKDATSLDDLSDATGTLQDKYTCIACSFKGSEIEKSQQWCVFISILRRVVWAVRYVFLTMNTDGVNPDKRGSIVEKFEFFENRIALPHPNMHGHLSWQGEVIVKAQELCGEDPDETRLKEFWDANKQAFAFVTPDSNQLPDRTDLSPTILCSFLAHICVYERADGYGNFFDSITKNTIRCIRIVVKENPQSQPVVRRIVFDLTHCKFFEVPKNTRNNEFCKTIEHLEPRTFLKNWFRDLQILSFFAYQLKLNHIDSAQPYNTMYTKSTDLLEDPANLSVEVKGEGIEDSKGCIPLYDYFHLDMCKWKMFSERLHRIDISVTIDGKRVVPFLNDIIDKCMKGVLLPVNTMLLKAQWNSPYGALGKDSSKVVIDTLNTSLEKAFNSDYRELTLQEIDAACCTVNDCLESEPKHSPDDLKRAIEDLPNKGQPTKSMLQLIANAFDNRGKHFIRQLIACSEDLRKELKESSEQFYSHYIDEKGNVKTEKKRFVGIRDSDDSIQFQELNCDAEKLLDCANEWKEKYHPLYGDFLKKIRHYRTKPKYSKDLFPQE